MARNQPKDFSKNISVKGGSRTKTRPLTTNVAFITGLKSSQKKKKGK
jgi:hypothetical protein